MVVAMDVADVRAAASHGQLTIERRLASAFRIAPSGIATEGADRRPIRHRGRKAGRKILEVAIAINRSAAQNGHDGGDVLNAIIRHRKIIVGQDRKVGELAS